MRLVQVDLIEFLVKDFREMAEDNPQSSQEFKKCANLLEGALTDRHKELPHEIVNILCPFCDSYIPFHCWNGERKDTQYMLDEAPLVLVEEICSASKRGELGCPSCGADLALTVRWTYDISMLSDRQRYKHNWREE